jgi:hypothetical protein
VTARGVVPARGHLSYCGTCGGVIAFAEEYRPGRIAQVEADRVTLAVTAHFTLFPECRPGNTFEGRTVDACRCARPMRIPREDGLFCARCDGRIAPDVAGWPRRRAGRGGAR